EHAELLVALDELAPLSLLLGSRAGEQHPQILDRGPGHAVVQVHEHRALVVPQQVAEVAVAMQADLPRGAYFVEHALDAFEQRFGGTEVRLLHVRREHSAVDHLLARLEPEPLDRERQARAEWLHATDAVDAREAAAEHRARFGRIELGRAAAQPGEYG